MTGFAGSRSLDERRRRRLATGAETVALEAVAEPAPRRAAPAKVKQKRRSPSHFPLRKVLSARYWKLAAIVLCAALAGVDHGRCSCSADRIARVAWERFWV